MNRGARTPAAPDPDETMLTKRAVLRGVVGFFLALAFWFGFSRPYEKAMAAGAQFSTNVFESPDVTRLRTEGSQILVDRRDFPPGSARPSLPAPDIHFNFVLLGALFAMDPRPLRGAHVVRFLAASAALFAVHVLALTFQVHSVYATSLGAWSDANYGKVSSNVWATGWHFYLIAGRFAAPFALWWLFGRRADEDSLEKPEKAKRRKRKV